METISLKIGGDMLKCIDTSLKKNNFSTRTEFIRDAIREKLSELEKEEILKQIARLRGSSKRKTTDAQLEVAREKAFAELEKKIRVR